MKIKAHTVSSLLTCWPPRTPLVLYASHFLMAFESDDIFNEGAEQKHGLYLKNISLTFKIGH